MQMSVIGKCTVNSREIKPFRHQSSALGVARDVVIVAAKYVNKIDFFALGPQICSKFQLPMFESWEVELRGLR